MKSLSSALVVSLQVLSTLSVLSSVDSLPISASASPSSPIPPKSPTSSNQTVFYITALTNHPHPPYLARLQCWALATPFTVYPTVGRALALGDVDNATYVVLPPRSAEGWHRPPHNMFFVLLSGVARVYVPHSGESRSEDGVGGCDYGFGRGRGGDDYRAGCRRHVESPKSKLDRGLDSGFHVDDNHGVDLTLESPRSDSSSSSSSSSYPRQDQHQHQQSHLVPPSSSSSSSSSPLPLPLPQQSHDRQQLYEQHLHPDAKWDTITITPGSPHQILIAADTDPRARGHLTFYPGDGETVALQIPFRRGAAGSPLPAHRVVHEGACWGDE
ncbi:uncharacterized protein Z520_08714 [Fonsecaea multimorphosa CBS 102226]|uniref:Cupin type-1 domain-containing protein n=1 Tax=Fonsecaea multimorphosa CBS 102226 TaxID=1442371 RepID=A0A0D2JYF4_9EURO|nr:uncharacterized protein Z520_08714 [Fonsecaea multimorphosa CBS 102226]KIX95594.1 hypothetical protein Z520_08714 [Fonsecaea multimorphosa CBS 102226]OAL21200.1 hypothetical protein AYO22_08163 [Fonsecaea multimorphosa]